MGISEKTLEQMMEQIAVLCRTASPSGFTREIQDYVVGQLEHMGFSPTRLRKGGIQLTLGGESHPIVVLAHLDTLGAMVRSIKGNGRLRLTRIGGYPPSNVEAENCTVHTREGKIFSGTIQLVHSSTHVFDDVGTMKRDEENLELVLDEKVFEKEQVQKLGISPGDFVSLDPRTVITPSGFLKSRHLDDKASAGILMMLARLFSQGEFQTDRKVTLFFTTYEEVGHGAAAGIPADTEELLAVDMGAVGDDLETNEFTVSICAKDSSGPYDFEMTNRLIELAKQNKLEYAVDIYPRYGSDTATALGSGSDARFALIGPGVSASHGYERTHREGLENTLRLLMAYLGKQPA